MPAFGRAAVGLLLWSALFALHSSTSAARQDFPDAFNMDDGTYSIDDMGDEDDDHSAEQAEITLSDQVGDDWGDAALEATQQLATRRLVARNRRLRKKLTQLQQGNQQVAHEIQDANRAGSEAEAFGHRIDQQVSALLRFDRDRQMFQEQGQNMELGDSNREVPQNLETAANTPTSINVTAQLAALGVVPSKRTLSQDLLEDAVNVGKGDIKAHSVAGSFCTQMVEDGILTHKDCNLGSKMTCNGYFQFCQLERTNGIDQQIECNDCSAEDLSCASNGVLDCERAEAALGAKRWLMQKKEEEKLMMKKAMEAAWMQAKYQARKREEALAQSQKAGLDAVKSALDQGAKNVEIATLKGNAPLPQPKVDSLVLQFKTQMRQMKFELIDKEKIFVGLRKVNPNCNMQYEQCGEHCEKTEPVRPMAEASLAIMGKVTKCQMQCKENVIKCVMNFVGATYKNITVEAMQAAKPNFKL